MPTEQPPRPARFAASPPATLSATAVVAITAVVASAGAFPFPRPLEKFRTSNRAKIRAATDTNVGVADLRTSRTRDRVPVTNGGVVFTWSREHIDSRTRRQIGFCALFPFAPSLLPLLPFCRRRSFHPLIAHRPSMSYLPRLVDGHIYGELYAMLFGTDNRGDVSTNVLLR